MFNETPLTLAIGKCNYQIVKLLLNRKDVDVNIKYQKIVIFIFEYNLNQRIE